MDLIKAELLQNLFYTTGVSGKSQVLYAMVFTTRYLDLFVYFISVYNTSMKIIFILATYATLFLMFHKFRSTYDSHHDTFRAELLVVPCVGLAVLVNHDFTLLEVSNSLTVTVKCLCYLVCIQ